MIDFECCFLDFDGKPTGPRVLIEGGSLHAAIERAMELIITADSRSRGFELRSEGERKAPLHPPYVARITGPALR
jgi:hypothetical protein